MTVKGSGWFVPMPLGVGQYDPRLRALRTRSGCYAIRTASFLGLGKPKVRYVGESHTGALYKTLTRHFQAWSRSDRGRFWEHERGPIHSYSPTDCEVQVWPCAPGHVGELQADLIVRLNPSDNRAEPVPF